MCTYTRHCPSDCFCCEFEACDCHSVCPIDCQCSYDATWSTHIVQCNRSDMPRLLPETMTEFHFHDNHLEYLPSTLFIGKTRLIKLNLARNQLQSIGNDTFCSAMNLEQIDLNSNKQLRIDLRTIDELVQCLKHLQIMVLSREQLVNEIDIDQRWTIENDRDETNLVRIRRRTISLNSLFDRSTKSLAILPYYSHELITSATRFEHNYTLIIVVLFLLLFVLFFLVLLISLTICRRKLRRHFKAEQLQRQRCHYLPSSSVPIADRQNRTVVIGSESLYEQLPSLSSDSEQAFVYHETNVHAAQPPTLPPYPPRLHSHVSSSSSSDYQPMTMTSSVSAHRCPTVLIWSNPYDYCRSNSILPLNIRQYDHNDRTCSCHSNHVNTYVYPHLHR
jgi:hypothetical protein